MFDLFRNKRIQKLSDRAEAYVGCVYDDGVRSAAAISPSASRTPGVKYSLREYLPAEPATDTVRCSRKIDTSARDEDANGKVRRSMRDLYSSVSVDRLMYDYTRSNDAADLLRGLERSRNSTFIDCMIEHIDRKQLRDSAVYRAAQLDRRLFSKMVSDREYKPAKDTALAVIFALKLTLPEAEDMLSRAGYTLSHSNKRDSIIEFFLKEKVYDLNDVNSVLYRLDQKIIGR